MTNDLVPLPKKKALPIPSAKVAGRAFRQLQAMLGYCRPAGSRTEEEFISRFIRPLGVFEDPFGNLFKRIGDSPIMWSCHTDTVHRLPGYQFVEIKNDILQLHKQSKSNCLGADDTAGVWIMTELIRRRVPGLYIFHREEECGGGGSKFIAAKRKHLIKDTKFAIALDRRGYGDVITKQAGGRCCSDEFADSLIQEIGGDYTKDPTGLFTDTANYVDDIGECTNLSVGYHGAHSSFESLNANFVVRLVEALALVDHTKLVSKRAPGEDDKEQWWKNNRHYRIIGTRSAAASAATFTRALDEEIEEEDADEPEFEKMTIEELCQEFPDIAGYLLDQSGVTAAEFRDIARDWYGK